MEFHTQVLVVNGQLTSYNLATNDSKNATIRPQKPGQGEGGVINQQWKVKKTCDKQTNRNS